MNKTRERNLQIANITNYTGWNITYFKNNEANIHINFSNPYSVSD